MKKEARVLLDKAVDSLVLGIHHFNSIWDRGRQEAVLILLDRAFELFLKSAILHRGGLIRQPRAKQTIGFDKCLRKCLTEDGVSFLKEEEAISLQMLNTLRDAAQHHILDISENQLYLHAQGGVTLFDDLMERVFGIPLRDQLPERALPVSTTAPTGLAGLFEREFSTIRELVKPGRRRRLEARAKMRALAILEAALEGRRVQPSEQKLGRLLGRVAQGIHWEELFPGVASLNLSVEDSQLGLAIRITKSEGKSVHLVPEGTPGADTLAVKRVDELGFYSLTTTALAEKCSLTRPRAIALVRHLELQEDQECYKEFVIDGVRHKRYSPKALDKMKKALPTTDMEAVWREHGPRKRRGGESR